MKRIFLRNYNYTPNEFYVYRLYILYKIGIIFPTNCPSILTQIFSSLRETPCVVRVKFFAEASGRFTHAVLPLIVVGKTASSDCILHHHHHQ